MHVPTLLLPLLSLLTLANPTSPTPSNPGAALVSSIATIKSNVITTNSTVNQLQQGSRDSTHQALAIQQATLNLGNRIVMATIQAQHSPALDDSASANVATAVLDLQPAVFDLLDNLKAHKPAFQTALSGHSVIPIVLSDLRDQKDKTARFGVAVQGKLDATYSQLAPIVNKQFADKFDDAIAYFST